MGIDLSGMIRPDAGLFFSRNDPNDPRLGEYVNTEEVDYDAAHIVVIGCPQDEGVLRNGGRTGAADGPRAIREQFYRLTTFNVKKRIVDIGDVATNGSLEEIHDRLTGVARRVLADGKRVIVLGGGNDISYADGVAMSELPTSACRPGHRNAPDGPVPRWSSMTIR